MMDCGESTNTLKTWERLLLASRDSGAASMIAAGKPLPQEKIDFLRSD
jgi:hypothetical protein